MWVNQRGMGQQRRFYMKECVMIVTATSSPNRAMFQKLSLLKAIN